ncbi:MAG: TetR/AcrR family transcriptional regulator [Oscillospiraceae bacterium]|jgi:TetR/AcrR family acrAB operon transcriptional repressor|nr:TetR/AcrR family transcriptional regulator [Oscillospiraceae bacterium]
MDIDISELSVFRILGKDYNIPFESEKGGTKEKILVYSTMLFAMRGYTAVSMKDIAAEAGIQSASLYYHFPSKGALWREVVGHTEELYRLYHDILREKLLSAESIEELLEILFHEPEKMDNIFTCFAFSLIQSEQFRDEQTWRVYNETFMRYSIDVISASFDRAIRLGFAPQFDTVATAAAILYFVLQQTNITTQKLMGRVVPHDPPEFVKQYHAHLLNLLHASAR